jgi:hypothetical protein
MASATAPIALVPGTKISLAELEEMFASMSAKTKWNLDGPMLWGYFFVAPDRSKLDLVSKRLTATGYRFVEYLPPDNENNAWMLHLERVERHTPKTLDARNDELYRVAHELGVEYDGMDVGPPDAGVP